MTANTTDNIKNRMLPERQSRRICVQAQRQMDTRTLMKSAELACMGWNLSDDRKAIVTRPRSPCDAC